ncbi:hypothetical protein IV203_012674 [Nitzschia inconspicua]|uniref:Transmembrane protein n=1 Tax=Nitzschia inconspicua TaxID=303405 RepID=A0A9K3KUX2_9STRA|nr:hypothetical protein IV203_014261 [Nitzschia inconspicua]KAG7350077.1 hypothetical protein IV203_012674 [Nitzschia inconspicua]
MPPTRPEHRLSHGGSTDGTAEENPGAVSMISPVRSQKKKDTAADSGPLKNPEEYNAIQNLNEIPMWLAPCNFVAAVFQIMQAVFIFAFSVRVDLKWCLYTFYPNPENDVYDSDIYAIPDPEQIACYTITWYAGAVTLMSGINHLCAVLPCFREKYEYFVERHQCPQRWIEYSFSCSLLRVHIAQVAGVTDVYTLVLSFFLTQAMVLFGLLHERMNAKNRADGYVQDYTAFWASCVMHLASWAVIFAYFIEGMSRVDNALALGLVLTLFLFELTFPVVFVLQWCKIGPFEDYLVGEFTYCLLSFTTKTLIAWTTLIGANAYARKG